MNVSGLGLHQLRGRAQQWLAWKLKSRTQCLIPGCFFVYYRTVLISPRYANFFDPLTVCWEQFNN